IPPLLNPDESSLDAAVRVTGRMSGECLVIQGPPGTGKTYTGARVMATLLASGKRVGVTSNSHRAIANMVATCGKVLTERGGSLQGVVVCNNPDKDLLDANPGLTPVESSPDAFGVYSGGIIAGTAWLFSRPEWIDALDFLFVDEGGQVALANAVAMGRCAK